MRHGKGFSISSVYAMRQFYLKYQKFQTVSGKSTWSHYVVLLAFSDDLARGFYAKQCVNETWSVRNLERQVNSMLFERITLSKDKNDRGRRRTHWDYSRADKKDYALVEYALGGVSDKLFVSKYQLYLPDRKVLQNKLNALLGRDTGHSVKGVQKR